MEKKKVGVVTHYYTKIGVAIVDVTAPLKVGDELFIEGTSTNLKQKASSIQIEHKNIQQAKRGDSIGLKVEDRVREGDIVYKVEE